MNRKLVLNLIIMSMFSAPLVAHARWDLERVVTRLEKLEASSDPHATKVHEALEAYRAVDKTEGSRYQRFVGQIKSVGKLLKSEDFRDQIKQTRRACRKDFQSAACTDAKGVIKRILTAHFDTGFVRFGMNEFYRDVFMGLGGYKQWGDSENFRMYGIGFELARSLFNFGVCLIPNKADWNFGVVTSAVAGLGITTGIYVGQSGVCFDFAVMYGIGAYVALSTYDIGYTSDEQPQNQLQGDEETGFPGRLVRTRH